MSIRAFRLCHHCAVPLSEDECLHYVFECHVCVVSEHDLEVAVRRDPAHPDAARLLARAVDAASRGLARAEMPSEAPSNGPAPARIRVANDVRRLGRRRNASSARTRAA